MKLETDKKIGFDSNMGFDGVDASISADDMHKLWDILQDPYKNSIGAVVREYVSNSFDSHAEANFIKHNDLAAIRNEYSVYNTVPDEEIIELKKRLDVFDDDAVVVSIGTDTSGAFWATEDFGIGLSPSRVINVFANYLKSTKETSNNVIGAFGIGSKSGLSYTDIVFIRTRYNGKEYEYWLRKGEKGPRLEFVNEMPTTERNGTQIKIYIKVVPGNYQWQSPGPETNRFEEECKKQLAYFDNVYFTGTSIDNNYSLYRGKHWIKNNAISPFSGLHLCLGKVAYPIDFNALGIPQIHFPVALKFEIGELDVIQTREDVRYNPKTKTAILNKIELLKEEFKERWEENQLETSDLGLYLQNRNKVPVLDLNGATLYLEELFGPKILKVWKFVPFDKINFNCPIEENLFFEYHVSYRITPQRLVSNNLGSSFGKFLIEQRVPFYRIKGNTTPLVNKYISQELTNGQDVYLVRKYSHINLGHYKKYLKLEEHSKENWRAIISSFQKEVQKYLIQLTKSYDKVVVPKDWGATQKNKKAIDRTLYNANIQQLHDGYNIYFSPVLAKWRKQDIDNSNKQYLIAANEDKNSLNSMTRLYYYNMKYRYPDYKKNPMLMSSKKIISATLAPTNIRHFKDMRNVTTLEDFLQGHSLVFKQTMTALKLSKNAELTKILDNEILQSWSEVYSSISEDASKLAKYVAMASDISMDDPFYKSCYAIAETNNLWDFEMLAKAERVLDYFKDLHLLEYMFTDTPPAYIVNYIRMHNKINPISKRKRVNAYFYVNFNYLERQALEENTGTTEKVVSDYLKLTN